MALPSQRPQINALTATRAVAAIMVFINHFGCNIFPFNLDIKLFHSGNIVVGYFFVLSGFVLYISYAEKNYSYFTYIKKRLFRIVPVYLLALFITISIAVWYSNYNIFAARSIKEMVFSSLLMQSLIPTYPFTLNLPGWTISVEMFFYLLFPLLLLLQKKNLRVFIVLAIVLYVLSQYIHLLYFPIRHTLSDNIVDTIFFSPEIHLNQFLIGMIGGYLFKNITWPKYRLLPALLLAVIVLLIQYKPENISYHAGLIAPVFMLLIITIACNNPPALNFKPFLFLGEISYGIYILQSPVYQLMFKMNTAHMHLTDSLFFCFTLIVLILFATATYYIIELPLRKKINSVKVN